MKMEIDYESEEEGKAQNELKNYSEEKEKKQIMNLNNQEKA